MAVNNNTKSTLYSRAPPFAKISSLAAVLVSKYSKIACVKKGSDKVPTREMARRRPDVQNRTPNCRCKTFAKDGLLFVNRNSSCHMRRNVRYNADGSSHSADLGKSDKSNFFCW